MLNKDSGFTLIELVMVIVIIAIMSAVALPKFVNLQGDAQQGATDGVAGALSSAAATNYAARSSNSTLGVSIGNCTDVSSALQGALPSTSYTIGSSVVSVGTSANCTLTGPGSKTATFTAIGI